LKLTRFLALIAVGAVALVGFDQYSSRTRALPEVPAVQAAQARAPAGDPPWGASRPVTSATSGSPLAAADRTRCDGRTHCSQMTSCAEAKYFLRNCPNTRMDGNNDGVPCERQWCN